MSADSMLKPVEKQTLVQGVMRQLVAYIQSGSLAPGDALPGQHELARRLSVSRPVLREAMQGLATAGLIEIRAGAGCFVLDPQGMPDPETLVEIFTHESALEVLEARMVVEVELAALAAGRATSADIAAMERILVRLKRAGDRGQATAQITSDFHLALARAGHNTVLFRMAQLLTPPRMAQGLRVEHSMPDISAREHHSHQVLLDAVRSGDPARARAAMREHLERAHGWEERIDTLRRAIAAGVDGDRALEAAVMGGSDQIDNLH